MLLQRRHGRGDPHCQVYPVGTPEGVEKGRTDQGRDQSAIYPLLHRQGQLGGGKRDFSAVFSTVTTRVIPDPCKVFPKEAVFSAEVTLLHALWFYSQGAILADVREDALCHVKC